MTVTNSAEAFALWAISQLLVNMSVPSGIPNQIKIEINGYKTIHTQFFINDKIKVTLLDAIREIFVTLGEEELLPTLLPSVDIVSKGEKGFCDYNPHAFLLFTFSKKRNFSLISK